MKKVLITGSNGFVGRYFCKIIVQHAGEVIATLHNPGPLEKKSENLNQVVTGDLSEFKDWDRTLEGVDVIFHLAGRAHMMGDNLGSLPHYRKVNVAGTNAIAEAAVRSGVRRLVYISSIKAVSERSAKQALKENHEAKPEDAYGISKLEAESSLISIASRNNLEVSIVRPVIIHGPGVKGNLRRLINWIDKGIPLPLGGIVNNRRSMIGLDNLCEFLITLAKHQKAANEIFHIADNEAVSTAQLIKMLAKAMNKTPRLIPVPAGILNTMSSLLGKQEMMNRLTGSMLTDTSKARTLLKWHPSHSLEEGINKMVLAEKR